MMADSERRSAKRQRVLAVGEDDGNDNHIFVTDQSPTIAGDSSQTTAASQSDGAEQHLSLRQLTHGMEGLVQRLRDRIMELDRSVETKATQLERCQRWRFSAETRVRALNVQNDALEAQLMTARAERSEMDNLIAENLQLKRAVEEAAVEKTNFIELGKLREENRRLKRAAETEQATLSLVPGLRARIGKLEGITGRQAAQIDTLNLRCDRWGSQVTKYINQTLVLEEQLETAKAETSKKDQQLSDKSLALDLLSKEKSDLKEIGDIARDLVRVHSEQSVDWVKFGQKMAELADAVGKETR